MKILAIGLLLQALEPCAAFQPTTKTSARLFTKNDQTRSIMNSNAHDYQSQQYRHSHSLIIMDMHPGSDDDEYIDDADLGDWRSFRKTLVDSGLSLETAEEGLLDEDANDDKKLSSPTNFTDAGDFDDFDASKGSPIERPKSVSKANEELLKSQSETLAKEYTDGVWAHEASFAEVGGLIVRMPLEVEIFRSKDKLIIGKELKDRLERNEDDSNTAPFFQRSSDNKKKLDLSCSLIAAQTLLWFRKAQSLIEEEMEEIASRANAKGEINPKTLQPRSENLLKLYLDNQENWQEVCLVASRNEMDGSAVTYALNRPMAFRLSENTAKMVLFGAFSVMSDGKVPVSQTNRYSKFLRAFEKSCAVYIGGPDKQDKPGVMIHGIADLEGAREISPGTGLYIGGVEAAVDGVLEGKYKPLDFRFFMGCHNYQGGDLDVAVYSNKYQPIACARSLALKQCIQLPKPLWHEVMEMCGGELREVSRLEMMKRDDIQE